MIAVATKFKAGYKRFLHTVPKSEHDNYVRVTCVNDLRAIDFDVFVRDEKYVDMKDWSSIECHVERRLEIKLLKCVVSGDTTETKYFLEQLYALWPNLRASHNMQSPMHWALYYATLCGHIDIVKMLLDMGAQPNLSKPLGAIEETPINVAADLRYTDIFMLLRLYGSK